MASRLVLDPQVRCYQDLLSLEQRFDARGSQSRCQQCSFDRIGRLACVKELLGGMGKRVKEVADLTRRQEHL